ncbi:Nn.00g040590.m01.CDS01 [Neocucurbitaria sp. VM-36]
MNPGDVVQSRFVHALRTQGKAEYPLTSALPCPYPGHHGRIFQTVDQLFDHAKTEHHSEIANLEPRQARAQLKEAALKLRRSDQSLDATVGDRSTPDITGLSLEPAKEPRQASPSSGKKRRADDEFHGRRGKAPSHVEVADADFSRQIPYTIASDRTRPKSQDPRLFDPKQSGKGPSSPYQATPEPSSEWSVEATKSSQFHPSQSQSPARQSAHRPAPKPQFSPRQPGLIELQRYDPRYPGLLLQPDSRPISQEQLASEVKSIYAGLTMVETKCIHVDRAQAAAAQDNSDSKLASDHWQALIALHRTLLHEHHDFFLASQHPSASPALRRLAAKYSMPARMWKHGIHSFLELLRRRLPDSIDYMLAFIYLAYQMMALLYETVPAFEDTWIECLGDLGRYRMAIEDEDIRDRETWAGVARSWYTKAADKNPTVGRLYHHLAILARPNALQQLYYYSRSLTCVKPFPSARESILTLLDPILGRAVATYSHALPIDTNFIKAHALLFEKLSLDDFEKSMREFTSNLDNHIGRVTAKWKEQGVYIAVTNIAGWFEYGVDDNPLRQVFLAQLYEKAKGLPPSNPEDIRTASPADQQDPIPPSITESEIPSKVSTLTSQVAFVNAKIITNDTFALVLRRIGDKNVLPHVHIMLSFLTTFATNKYVSHLLADTPWAELVAFLNTLVKTENQISTQSQNQSQTQDINTLLATDVFPEDGERADELPLPEDYLVRGLIWAHEYFPKKWFEREHDEEERYLELASTVKSRMERVLRLGYQLSTCNCWISYDKSSRTFSVIGSQPTGSSP